jgi:hypothetical protein
MILGALEGAGESGGELRIIPGELTKRMFRSAGFGELLDEVTVEEDGR